MRPTGQSYHFESVYRSAGRALEDERRHFGQGFGVVIVVKPGGLGLGRHRQPRPQIEVERCAARPGPQVKHDTVGSDFGAVHYGARRALLPARSGLLPVVRRSSGDVRAVASAQGIQCVSVIATTVAGALEEGVSSTRFSPGISDSDKSTQISSANRAESLEAATPYPASRGPGTLFNGSKPAATTGSSREVRVAVGGLSMELGVRVTNHSPG